MATSSSEKGSESEEEVKVYDPADDRLINECLNRFDKRSSKKKKNGRDLLGYRGSERSLRSGGSTSSGKHSTSGKHGRRQDVVKKQRNEQRVFKELETVLDVFDFGIVPSGAEDALSDRTDAVVCVECRPEPGGTDGESIQTEVATEAMSDFGIQDDADQQWEQYPLAALDEVLAHYQGTVQPDRSQLPVQVQALLKQGEEKKEHLLRASDRSDVPPWSSLLFKALESSMTLMNEIVNEMKVNCRECMSNTSLASASSGGSLVVKESQSLLWLLNVLQDLYYQVTASCTILLQMMESWFRAEPDFGWLAEEGFVFVHKAAVLLKQLNDFEIEMCLHGVGPSKIMSREEAIRRKEEQLMKLMTTLHDCVRRIQESILVPHNIKPDPQANSQERRELSKTLQQCWEQLREVTCRVATTHPHLKHELFTSLLLTLNDGVIAFLSIQKSDETQELIRRMARVIPDGEESGECLSDGEISAQAWLLPCLRKSHSVTNDLLRQIHKSTSFKENSTPETDIIVDLLKNHFKDLVLNSIARMITLTQNCETLELRQIQERRDHGLAMLHLIKRYDSGCLSANFEVQSMLQTLSHANPVPSAQQQTAEYIVFRNLVTGVLNNVLGFQTKVQVFKMSGPRGIDRQGSLTASGEMVLVSMQAKYSAGCSQSPHAPRSETTTASTRIGTYPIAQDSQEEDGLPSEMSNASMPTPFRHGMAEMSIPTTEDFLIPERHESGQGHPNPLSSGRLPDSLQAYPISQFTDGSCSYVSGTVVSGDPENKTDCPETEQFYVIDKSELVYGPRLGYGSTGQVFKMHYRGTPVAVKIMNFPYLLETRERLVHEADMHRRLAHHPHIVQFYGQCVGVHDKEHAVGLVMELCDIGSLLKVISEAGSLGDMMAEGLDVQRYQKTAGYIFNKTWPLRIKIICDIASGMEFLHSREMVHRDLTSYNVVVSHGGATGAVWKGKVCDFERSRHIPSGSTIPRSDTMPNSVGWSAPEVIRGEQYSTQADVFSIGVILWELVHLQFPWSGYNDAGIQAQVKAGKRLPFPEVAPDGLAEYPQLVALIEDTWKEDPDERPTMNQFHRRIDAIQKELVYRLRAEDQKPS